MFRCLPRLGKSHLFEPCNPGGDRQNNTGTDGILHERQINIFRHLPVTSSVQPRDSWTSFGMAISSL